MRKGCKLYSNRFHGLFRKLHFYCFSYQTGPDPDDQRLFMTRLTPLIPAMNPSIHPCTAFHIRCAAGITGRELSVLSWDRRAK